MNMIRKSKPNDNMTGLLIPFSILGIGALVWAVFGRNPAFYTISGFVVLYACYSLLVFLRTRNPGYLLAALFQFSVAMIYPSFPLWDLPEARRFHDLAVKLAVIFLVPLLFQTVTKRTKWRGSELLELAALPVEDADGSFTARPRPAGKTEFSPRVLKNFAHFAAHHLIALPYVEAERVVFVLVTFGEEFGHILNLRRDLTKETWVAFDFSGNVTVQITERDYQKYCDDLSFDQLCQSMSDLFVKFILLYKKGEGARVIDKLNAVRVGIFE